MAIKRDYGQFCGLAGALNVIGERWTLLVIRELLIDGVRFTEIMDNLPGIGPNLLAERLRVLGEHGVVEQLPVRGDARGRQYRLTELGRRLCGPVLELARWGMSFLSDEDGAGVVRGEWGFLAVQAMVRPDAVPDEDQTYEFRIGEPVFVVRVRGGEVSFARGGDPAADLVVTSDPDTFVRIGAQMLTPFQAMAAGRIRVEGDQRAIHCCVRMLGLS
ncbi:winged helix-turn-helix transcriptional regulator [Saccharothrix lopnurensis]|uniref:Winged helix-turn-helix transcriptional regulator n=1 Tax=Saccharothrix lopnurensis TaxID=1670621 RepID=A0ABW1PC46_9PSEU